jgi:hypothetical protein
MKDNQGMLEPDLYGEDGELLDQTGEKLESTDDEITRESTPIDYIHWEDFFIFPVNARTWSEVVAVGKRVYMTYTQMAERFGRDIAKKIPLQKDERLKFTYENVVLEHEVKGEVYEIWNKEDRCVYWVAEGYHFLCDRKEDPLNLEHFFPCPRPIIANQTNGTLIPVADYIQYQDQAAQIDDLSQRIAMLTRACKVAGVYDAASRGIRRLLDESVENELIPVDNWAAFAEKGGIGGQVSFLPLKEIIGVLNQLVQMKQMQIEEMDRLTGINDLMRGTNDARETLGGVRLKSNYTGTRLTARQNEVARFARDLIQIMADIMCQHFAPKSLVEASGAMFEEGLGVNVDDIEDQMASLKPPTPPQMPPQQQQLMSPHPAAPAPTPQTVGGNVVPFQPRIGGLPVSVGPRPGMPVPSAPLQAPPVAPGLPAMAPPSPLQIAIQQALGRIDRAIALLRNERLRGFRVDIEVDSTIYGDAAQEKGDRNEFVEVVTKYLQTAMQMSASIPEITPLLGKLLQFGVRGYRVGRDLEASIEEFCDQAVKIAKQRQQAAQNQPNPEMIKAQAQAETAKAAATSAQTRAQADVAKSQADIATAKINAQANQQQAASEMQRQQLDNQGEAQNQQMDLAIKSMEMRMREMEVEIEQMRLLTRAHQAQQPPIDQGGLGNERGIPNRNAV